MRISSVKSVLDNYNELVSFLEEVSHTEHDEIGFKSSGYPGSTAILANAPATLAEYSVSAVFCPISVQYRKPIKSRFTDADVSGYAAGIGEMQLSEI